MGINLRNFLLIIFFLNLSLYSYDIKKTIIYNSEYSELSNNYSSWKSNSIQTILKNNVPAALLIVLALEIVAGVLAVMGIIENITSHSTQLGDYACMVSCVTLLFLLFGQRLAKDYDGARTIVIYFIPAILGVYWL